jgi:hypothetical protein
VPAPLPRAAAAVERRPAWQARYVAQGRPLAQLTEPLRRQGGQVEMDRAQRWVALSDGGAGLEGFLRSNFPRVEAVTPDFCRAAEHLGKLAKALYPGRKRRAEAWHQWCRRLKAEGGGQVLAALRALDLRGRPRRGGDVLRQPGGADGLPGVPGAGLADGQRSGGERVQDGGRAAPQGRRVRWGEDSASAVCHLRALFRSADRQWEALWCRN